MLLVYGMTRATQHGWGTPATIGLLTASVVLIVSFFLIESRSKAPLLPLRIFRLRTLAGSNLAALITSGSVFSQFFLLTLYMQQVLHYSALKTGVAYIGLTLTTIAFSAVSQGLVTRFGVRRVLPVGLALSTVALVLFAQVPVHGHYFRDLFPGFIISGLGLAFAFIPMSIGALTGVRQADAGIASGLISTSQQIGGAIGVAAATTIATTFTNNYVALPRLATALNALGADARLPDRLLRPRCQRRGGRRARRTGDRVTTGPGRARAGSRRAHQREAAVRLLVDPSAQEPVGVIARTPVSRDGTPTEVSA